MLAVCRL